MASSLPVAYVDASIPPSSPAAPAPTAPPQEQIRVKIKLAKRRPEEVDTASNAPIEGMRTRAIAKRQMLLTSLLAEREKEIRELCILKLLPSGANVLEPPSYASALSAEIAKYHQKYPLEEGAKKEKDKEKDAKTPAAGSTPVAKTPKAPKHTPKTPPAAAAAASSASITVGAIAITDDSPPATPSGISALSVTKKVELSVEEIASKAAHDAQILKRVRTLQKDGLWLPKRIAAQPEPPRTKTHWDYLLEEMAWLAKDFQDERRWKIAAGRKLSRAVAKHHKELELEEKRKSKEEEIALRRTASRMAKEVKKFWSQIEKVVIFKAQQAEEVVKKAAREKQLDFLVGQTEKYSSMLAQELKAPEAAGTPAAEGGQATAGNAVVASPAARKSDVTMKEAAEQEESSSSSSEKPASVAELMRTEPAAEDAEEFKYDD